MEGRLLGGDKKKKFENIIFSERKTPEKNFFLIKRTYKLLTAFHAAEPARPGAEYGGAVGGSCARSRARRQHGHCHHLQERKCRGQQRLPRREGRCHFSLEWMGEGRGGTESGCKKWDGDLFIIPMKFVYCRRQSLCTSSSTDFFFWWWAFFSRTNMFTLALDEKNAMQKKPADYTRWAFPLFF